MATEYKAKLNPFTGQLQLVSTNIVLSFKAGVATQSALPLSGNAKGDARIANDTGHLYVWSIESATGLLTDWVDAGDIVDIDWSAITNKPSSSVANIDDAVSKRHTQNTDQYLDFGGASQVSAADVKDAISKKHDGTLQLNQNVAGELNTLIEKITPVDNDILLIEDSADFFNKKKVKKSSLGGGGGVPAGLNKQIQYNNAGAFGGSEVYYDNVNIRVGIGTNTPTHDLSIHTSTPYTLIKLRNSTTIAYIGVIAERLYLGTDAGATGRKISVDRYCPDDVIFVDSLGNMGIDKVIPTEKLDVNGNINATAYKVGGVAGATGTFLSSNVPAKTVTVVNGIITSIV